MTQATSEPWEDGPPPGFAEDVVDVDAEEVARHFDDPQDPASDTSPTNAPVWPEPDPFGSSILPRFPVDALPSCMAMWAAAEAEFCQVPVDLPALLALGCASLAVSRGVDIVVRPGWTEPANVWIVYGAPPADRKSPGYAAATKPIHTYQASEAAKLAPEIAEYQSAKRVLEKKIAVAELAAAKGKLFQDRNPIDAIKELNAALVELPAVTAPVLIADDVTPEAVARVLSENKERLGILSAEGGPFEMMNGRYNDKVSNLEIWLKSHSGDAHTVHRINRPSISLSRPLTTIVITCQPSVISGLAAREGFRGRGLLARFLYALPISKVGTRDINPQEVKAETSKAYEAAITDLLTHGTRPRKLALSADSDAARGELAARLEPKLGEGGELRSVADWAGKLVGLVARIACVLHVADHAHVLHLPPSDGGEDFAGMPDEIPVTTWNRAERIGEYALAHARAAFDLMGSSEEDELAKRLWAWVVRKALESFTERDACRAVTEKAEDVAPAIAVLVERHLVRPRPAEKGKPREGRPPSPTYLVNPKAPR